MYGLADLKALTKPVTPPTAVTSKPKLFTKALSLCCNLVSSGLTLRPSNICVDSGNCSRKVFTIFSEGSSAIVAAAAPVVKKRATFVALRPLAPYRFYACFRPEFKNLLPLANVCAPLVALSIPVAGTK